MYRRRYISLIYIFYRYINMLFIKICKNIGYIYISSYSFIWGYKLYAYISLCNTFLYVINNKTGSKNLSINVQMCNISICWLLCQKYYQCHQWIWSSRTKHYTTELYRLDYIPEFIKSRKTGWSQTEKLWPSRISWSGTIIASSKITLKEINIYMYREGPATLFTLLVLHL